MHNKNIGWEPGFGTIYTWFAMDKNGKIAVMVNNCWGWLPESLLLMDDFEALLDDLNEYMWEESQKYLNYPAEKQGATVLDLYSELVHRGARTRGDVEAWVREHQAAGLNELNIPARKGFFIYHAIEGDNPGQDYPAEYDGETEMGDYFRYLVPTVYATANDFPQELHHGIAVSDSVDFCKDRLFNNKCMNEYFPRMYKKG